MLEQRIRFLKGIFEHPIATEEDIDYLIKAIHYMFPISKCYRKTSRIDLGRRSSINI